MKLSKAIREVERKNPNTIVVLKTEMYGMWWAGKAKFASTATTLEADCAEVKSIREDNGSVVLTV